MKSLLIFLFWPNPGSATYASPKAFALLIFCIVLVAASLVFSMWRKRQKNPLMKQLSRSWASTSFWFGLIGLIFVFARVENIQFLAMRIWWVFWIIFAIWYVYFQVKRFRARYYQVLSVEKSADPRSAYLPKRKRH